jgi:hypothetical protein
MKWLQDNPLGLALVSIGGVLALLALGMAIVWNLPVTVDADVTESENVAANVTTLAVAEIGSLGDFRVIDERPVFNESRTPVIVEDDDGPFDETDETIAVKDAPAVKLTGVIITPGMKIASLSPVDAKQDSVMAHEGQSLTGEFVGWQVSVVNPRNVVLESNDGQKLELELEVHDATIKEPPKPKPAPAAQTAKNDQADPGKAEAGADDEAPLSRAEQIRMRIAERREELRREQEEQANQEGGKEARPADAGNAYQNAIRSKIRNSRKDKDSNDNEDG